MEVKLNLSNTEHKELISYCNLNDLLVSEVVKKSFTTGFNIERYGLLGTDQVTERVVEKIVEKIVEVPVEVIKEVVIEKEPDDTKLKALEQTLQKLKSQLIDKDKKIEELEIKIKQVQDTPPTQVTYLRGSNLNNKLF